MCRVLKIGCLVVTGTLLLAFLTVLLAWRPILRATGEYLVFSDSLRKADAIVAVSGEESRRLTAIELYGRGYAPRIIFNVSDTTYYFGQPIDPVESVRQDAARHGVPDSAILINRDIGSTWEDARATRKTVLSQGLHSLIVVSSPFNMRRAALTYRKVFETDSLRITFISVPLETEKLSLELWWTRERELILVNNEYVKLILYYFKYFRAH
ncbi:YdcF family protein [bacterium]|nr:YdcF family protein [bacterium]